MKLYYPKDHYDPKYRGLVFPLLKPFLKGEGYTDAERVALYGISAQDFQFTETMEEADYVILPMAWNYYSKTKQTQKAKELIQNSAVYSKNVLIVNAGDFGVKIPFYSNCIVFRAGGYASKVDTNELAMPSFIGDPLKEHYQATTVFQREYNSKPVIGFCGQANPSLWNAGKELFKTAIRNLMIYAGLSKNEPQQLISTSFLRASILRRLERSTLWETHFIIRKKYRAGAVTQVEKQQTTREFYDNMKTSDYVVCVRGAGNFSVRLYETLAMGRIPIFINTDCIMPLSDTIYWKAHLVWIEADELGQIEEKVSHFHEALSPKDYIDLQLANRTLWEEKLTLRGFFKEFLDET